MKISRKNVETDIGTSKHSIQAFWKIKYYKPKFDICNKWSQLIIVSIDDSGEKFANT